MSERIRILGVDPGLRNTGWGIIECEGPRLAFIACGVIRPDADAPMAQRLLCVHEALTAVIAAHAPAEVAVEETFVSRDAKASLKLGHARGVALLVAAQAGLKVAEYAPRLIKKAVTGTGTAEKRQVTAMVRILLPRARPESADAADALAVAICHAHHRGAAMRLAQS